MPDVNLGKITVTLLTTPPTPDQRGAQPRPRPALTLAEAHAQATFDFDEPGYLPAGFDFADAAVIDSPAKMVVLTFASPSGENFLLAEAPLSQYQLGSDGRRTYFVVGDSLEESSVGGGLAARSRKRTAGNASSVGLVWESDALLKHIIGSGLSEPEIERIAASLH